MLFRINQFVIYKKDVCKIKEIKTIKDNTYYILTPIDDDSLSISIPTNTKYIRCIITKDEVNKIIKSIPKTPIITNTNDRFIEQEYKNLLNSGSYEDLIRIIKTTYLRNEKRLKDNKKISERDNNYFKIAERIIYNEFSVALNLSYDETKNYVITTIEKALQSGM